MNDFKKLMKEYGDIAYDPSTGDMKGYISFQLLHANALRRELKELSSCRLIHKMNIETDPFTFFKELIKFERDHEYKYQKNSGYETIYGVRIEILLPQKIKKDSEMKKLISRFMTELNPLAYNLPYAAFLIQRGNGRYIQILMSEREVVDCIEVVRYTRNYKSKDGTLLHRRGDPKLNADGKPIKQHVMFSSKKRIFVLDRPMEKIRKKLLRMLSQALRTILQHIKLRMFLKIRKPKRTWHYFNRQCLLEVNHAKRYIEYMCNYAADVKKREVLDLEHDQPYRDIPIPKYKEIQSVFMKYKARFEKNSYHDAEGNVFSISSRNIPYSELKENIERLIQMFQRDIRQIVPSVC